MKTLNRVQLIGLLGQEPKIYAMPSGILVAKLSLATQNIHKDKSTRIINKSTEWHSIVTMGALAEIAERFLQKGTCVHIDGSLKSRDYEDKDKITRYVTEIIANDMIILHNGKEEPVAKIFPQKKITTEEMRGESQ